MMPSENSAAAAATSPTTTAVGNKGAATNAVSPCTKGEGGDTKSVAPSFDPTEYVQKQRVTKTAPPKPAYNPLQFIQIKPCNLYQSAQDQLKKAEEVKKSKVTKKEDAEDWQGNLDSWKSSRRKRVEHIIERVVEVKKLEIEEHDRQRKKSKTFSEMMEERGGRRKISLPVYPEDDTNDFSDLGIGTSSASGKSSLSEDFDNHSVVSDNPDTEKSSDIDNHESNDRNCNDLSYRENISSPGYETCSSTAPTTSPDPSDFPYEGQRFKARGPPPPPATHPNKMDFAIAGEQNKFVAKRPSVTKIEDRLVNFELKSSTSENSESMTNGTAKKDLPKVDINKRRELFEKEGKSPEKNNRSSGDFSQQAPLMSIKQRLSNLERQKEESNVVVQTNRLSGDVTSIKDRLKNLEKETTTGQSSPASKVEIPLSGSIKDRLSSLHSSVSTTAATAPVVVATEEPLAANGKGAIVVGVAKKPWSASDVDQVIEVETLNIEVEQLKLSEPESLMTMESIQDAVQDYVTIVQDVKVTMSQTQSIREKEEYREITDEDLFGGTDIDMDADADVEIDNLQQDMSVLEALDIAFEAIDKDTSTQKSDCQSVANPNNSIHTVAAASSHLPTDTSVTGAAAPASTNFDQPLPADDACEMSSNMMEDERAIEQFIDDLIKQEIKDEDESHGKSLDSILYESERGHESIQLEHMILPVMNEEKKRLPLVEEPIYEIIEEVSEPKPLKSALKSPKKQKEEAKAKAARPPPTTAAAESYYQSPAEGYYEVPKPNPIPLYENVDIFLASVNESNHGEMLSTIPAGVNLEPPKVKPPPPPCMSEPESDEEEDQLDEQSVDNDDSVTPEENLKRMNSTKRIKKEIRNKRSSFLGIESSQDDELDLKLSVAPPPDMSALIEEERRLEKQFLKTYDGIVERSDSGVSESHSRQSSEPFTISSEEHEDRRKELEEAEGRRDWNDDARMQNIEEQIREQEEVLRVERELLQLEQEELKRQRTNLLLRENFARKELDHGSKMLMSSGNCVSLQDINQNMAINGNHLPIQSSSSTSSSTTSSTFNVMSPSSAMGYQMQMPSATLPVDYRQSMPDLQNSVLLDAAAATSASVVTGHHGFANGGRLSMGGTPPAKPSRQLSYATGLNGNGYASDYHTTAIRHGKAPSASDLCDELVQLREHHHSHNYASPPQQIGNMSRHTLHALSAVPKPKLTDVWVQQQATTTGRKSEPMATNNKYFSVQRKGLLTDQERLSGEPWIARKSEPPKGLGYGKHWLIQEAEQRRLDQQRGVRPAPNPQNWPIKSAGHLHRKSMPDMSGGGGGAGEKKPLPDAVINTLTQRVQNRIHGGVVGDKKRFDANPAIVSSNPSLHDGPECLEFNEGTSRGQEQVLSVSGKKKCSHCDEELGRGAAMIIESLRLFYHIDCFKCCVCLVRLGDGLNGTDVRVRNHKLHCQNCYSSDDGIKFSCV